MNLNPADSYSVTALSQSIEQALSSSPQFNDVLLQGEISNFIRAASGHIFFSLKNHATFLNMAPFTPQTGHLSGASRSTVMPQTGQTK